MLCVPAASRWQWHPFTVTSAPQDPFVSVHVHACGDWTERLAALVGDGSQGVAALGPVLLDGPFGAPAEAVLRHETCVLVGAGIGITPFASVLRAIWYRHREGRYGARTRPYRVELHWLCRDPAAFTWFRELMHTAETELGDILRVYVHVTARMEPARIFQLHAAEARQSADPITLMLRSPTRYGRPDFAREFAALSDTMCRGGFLGGGRDQDAVSVGVFCCGGQEVVCTVKEACQTQDGRGGISWHFYYERF